MTAPLADEQYMQRALRLAVRGQGNVEPNPMVGCVLVQDGRIIGEGYHRRFGGPHAEIEALKRATAAPAGATAYVTLEPCCHTGKTGPCTTALLQAGIQRVIAAIEDPNPAVAGKGLQQLHQAGVTIDVGICRDQARAQNAPFFKLVEHRRPWVIAKWAQSLDGKIATHRRDAQWITDQTCRQHAHRTRGRVDAILVGRSTVQADDPQLTCRRTHPRRIATRIILDRSLRTPRTSRLVQSAREIPTWIFHGSDAPANRRKALTVAGCVLHRVRTTKAGLSLPAVLDQLGRAQMTNVLVEGGGAVLGSFFDQQLIDEVHVYIAPLLIGGSRAPGALDGVGVPRVERASRLPKQATPRRLGQGWLIQARLGREAVDDDRA
jgi:diaminohydroxyphosphoribosylaminopyrimidine deaminase/5-amino-6-(5-phosphoribosylamino)uracil reductase